MDQLALPYRIGLVAILAVAAVWFVALRPSSDAGEQIAPLPTAAAPGTTGLSTAVDKAEGAVATSGASAAKTEAAAKAVDASPDTAAADAAAAAAAAKTEAAESAAIEAKAKAIAATKAKAKAKAAALAKRLPSDLSTPILARVTKGEVALVLFWDKRSAEDRATAKAVKAASGSRKKVTVTFVPISRVGRYPSITKGVPVAQAPTLVVIGKGAQATSIVGYADTRAVGQAIDDARKRAANKTA